MSKTFNTNGYCDPKLHYMVNLDSRLHEIKNMIDDGKYFTITRARQYGKTTILTALADFLAEDMMLSVWTSRPSVMLILNLNSVLWLLLPANYPPMLNIFPQKQENYWKDTHPNSLKLPLFLPCSGH